VEKRERKRVSLLGPILLIALGTVLLLNTLGILEWSVWWSILRLWPVLLIAAGLDLLLGRHSIWGSLLAAVLFVVIMIGALWLSGTGIGDGSLTTQEIREPLEGATEAVVVIEPGVGVLRIRALPESANLIEGEIHLSKGEKVAQDRSDSDGKTTFELRTLGGGPWAPFVGAWDEQRAWDLGLSPGPTLELSTSLGLGDARLDLTDMTLGDLQANMGLGWMEVTLPAEGRYQARIDGAIGAATIVIPEGVAARIHTDTGIAGRQLPADLQQQEENVYVSPNYTTAENRVDLDVSQAIGLLRIRRSE
jgi:hypothetical protein